MIAGLECVVSPTCSHVRGWDVNAGSKESLLGELHSESASDPFQLCVSVLFGVEAKAGLATAEGVTCCVTFTGECVTNIVIKITGPPESLRDNERSSSEF